MPRIRYIKPSFFDDTDVCALRPLTRLLFIGLWCWADKAGRLEDRPQRIKANILPDDTGSVDSMLDALTPKFIIRYEVAGRRYIQIKRFTLHQRPHIKELPSTIPAPDGYVLDEGSAPTSAPTSNGAETRPSTGMSSARSAFNGDGDGKPGLGTGMGTGMETGIAPPTPPATAGGDAERATRARNGSRRKRDVADLNAIEVAAVRERFRARGNRPCGCGGFGPHLKECAESKQARKQVAR